MKNWIILPLLAGFVLIKADQKQPCGRAVRVTDNKKCSEYIAMLPGMTHQQFVKLNPSIDCDEPNKDIIGIGMLICLSDKPCGLSVTASPDEKTKKSRSCRAYIEMTGQNPKDRLSDEEFAQLNPHVDCDQPNTDIIPDGTELCMYTNSKFDDNEIKARTSMLAFAKAGEKINQNKQRSGPKFDRNLLEFLKTALKEEENRRRKRQTSEDIYMKVAAELSDIRNLSSVEAVIKEDKDFRALNEEYEKWRPELCKQLRQKEQNDYRRCVCKCKLPYITCQALLTTLDPKTLKPLNKGPSPLVQGLRYKCNIPPGEKELDEGEAYKRPRRDSTFDITSKGLRVSRATTKAKDLTINKFIQKLMAGGCSSMETCFTGMCFSDEKCVPIPLPPPIPPKLFEFCVSGEACFPTVLGALTTVKAYTDAKFALKIGVCIADFLDLLSWLGLEKCLASVMFEYYYYRNQLDIAGQIALVVVKATVTTKIQVADSPMKKITIPTISKEPVCKHKEHKCQDYCAFTPGDFALGYKIEWWFFGWRTVKQLTKEDAVLQSPSMQSCST